MRIWTGLVSFNRAPIPPFMFLLFLTSFCHIWRFSIHGKFSYSIITLLQRAKGIGVFFCIHANCWLSRENNQLHASWKFLHSSPMHGRSCRDTCSSPLDHSILFIWFIYTPFSLTPTALRLFFCLLTLASDKYMPCDLLSGYATCDNGQYFSFGWEFCSEGLRSWNANRISSTS